jgi:hypothetical protein
MAWVKVELNREPTIKSLTEQAKKLGIVRARGTYNGAPFWRYRGMETIITRNRLLEILGYIPEEIAQ